MGVRDWPKYHDRYLVLIPKSWFLKQLAASWQLAYTPGWSCWSCLSLTSHDPLVPSANNRGMQCVVRMLSDQWLIFPPLWFPPVYPCTSVMRRVLGCTALSFLSEFRCWAFWSAKAKDQGVPFKVECWLSGPADSPHILGGNSLGFWDAHPVTSCWRALAQLMELEFFISFCSPGTWMSKRRPFP